MNICAWYSYLENRDQTHTKGPTQMHRIEASRIEPSFVFCPIARPANDGVAFCYDFNMRQVREL